MRVAAIRGIGRDYATSQDAEFLRGLYAKLPSEKTKDAVLESLGEMGGTANAKWLMTIAGNNDESLRLRRRAIQLTDRAGTSVADLAQLYDRVGRSADEGRDHLDAVEQRDEGGDGQAAGDREDRSELFDAAASGERVRPVGGPAGQGRAEGHRREVEPNSER